MKIKFNSMVEGYLVAALWSTLDYESDDDNLDAKYTFSDISEEFIEQAIKDCDFLLEVITDQLLLDDNDKNHNLDQLGHDFWLTRNRHGAGFWDGDYINGDAITDIVHNHFKENDDELNESIKREELYIINDWSGNKCFTDQSFLSFDDAESFLSCWITSQNLDYDHERQEYVIVKKDEE